MLNNTFRYTGNKSRVEVIRHKLNQLNPSFHAHTQNFVRDAGILTTNFGRLFHFVFFTSHTLWVTFVGERNIDLTIKAKRVGPTLHGIPIIQTFPDYHTTKLFFLFFFKKIHCLSYQSWAVKINHCTTDMFKH